LTGQNADKDDVSQGTLNCKNCRKAYPIIRSVPRFVTSDHYVRNFSKQWTRFSKTQLDTTFTSESRNDFVGKTSLDPKQLEGKLILEAGCGMGRFCEIVSKVEDAKVVGFDLSESVDSAQANVGARPNVAIVQADIMGLPFAKESFDVVFSIGVLHHTPDPKASFSKLVPMLKRGGRISIWVYPKYDWATFSDLYRHFTSRMPEWMLLPLVKLMIKIDQINQKAPRWAYKRLFKLLPVSIQTEPEHQVLDTFDWYSPKYQFKFETNEVAKWFEDEQLKEIQKLPFAVAITASKI
jgi:SAM-dependent methyltransferase